MKRPLLAATVLAMYVSTQALAQTVGVGPAETVVIEPEQRTLIRDYVVKERVTPVGNTSFAARVRGSARARSTRGVKLVLRSESSARTILQVQLPLHLG
jgi:hypothetical protein